MNLHQQLNDYIEQREHIAHNLGVKPENINKFYRYVDSLRKRLGIPDYSDMKNGGLVKEFITVSDEIARIEREIAG